MRSLFRVSTYLHIVNSAMASNGSPAPDVFSGSANPTAAVIFLHGLGDTSQGWTPVFRPMSRSLPHIRFVLPTAPSRPITLNMGMRMPAWFDIISLNRGSQEDAAGIKRSAEYVQSLVDEQVKAGIPVDRIIVGGFSQGAGVSYYYGLTATNKPAGIMPLSGWAPLAKDLIADESVATACKEANTVIFAAHGTEDGIVQYRFGQESFAGVSKTFARNEAKHVFKSYPMEHSASDAEIRDMTYWIKEILPPL